MVYKVLGPAVSGDEANLVSTLEYQVATYYPRLRSILVPTKGVWEQLANDIMVSQHYRHRYSPPPRWEEPIIQRHIQKYLAFLSAPYHPGVNNDHIDSDPVYANIVNPDVRKKILERRMSEKTYNSIHRQITQIQTPALLGGPATTEVAVRSPGKLVPYEEQERRFDDLPAGLLAVESGLQTPTVKRMLTRGLKGSQIVDAGFTMKDKETTSPVVERMMRQGIEDWSGLIDAARLMQCGVKFVLKIMDTLGPDNVEELTTLVDIAASDVTEFAASRRVGQHRAWYIFLRIYNGDARCNAERALDLFTDSYYQGWREDTNEYEELTYEC